MYNTYGAPFLSSYDAALRWYEATKPIRGTTTRPIGNRRYHVSASIEKDGDNIVLRYEGAPLVVWEPGSKFTLHAPAYYNAFQVHRMRGWLPSTMNTCWDDRRLFVSNGSSNIHLPRNGSLRFERIVGDHKFASHPTYQCVSRTSSREYKLRRGVVDKLIAEHYMGFLSWAQVVLAVDNLMDYEQAGEARSRLMATMGFTREYMERQDRAYNSGRYVDTDAQMDRSRWYQLRGRLYSLPFYLTSAGLGWVSMPASKQLLDCASSSDYSKWEEILKVIAVQVGTPQYKQRMQLRLSYAQVEKFMRQLVACVWRDTAFNVVPVSENTIPSGRNSGFFVDMLEGMRVEQNVNLSECSV